MKFQDAIELVQFHYDEENNYFPPFVLPLEAYARITEKLKGLKNQVFKKPADREVSSMSIEAAHLAATVLRFITELT